MYILAGQDESGYLNDMWRAGEGGEAKGDQRGEEIDSGEGIPLVPTLTPNVESTLLWILGSIVFLILVGLL